MSNLKSIAKDLAALGDVDLLEVKGESEVDPKEIISSAKYLLEVLLPGRFTAKSCYNENNIFNALSSSEEILNIQLANIFDKEEVKDILEKFFNTLKNVRSAILKDINAAYLGDPAARDHLEVIKSYPGILAIAIHRIAHSLYSLKVPYVPRILNEWAHSKTGIDIHPGAQIEAGLFIDHGTGVVIGETCKIGKNVKIYQGVTLGAKSFELDENGNPVKGVQRHPTVEDDVVIYANATILGGKTIIGQGSVIGGNVFITKSIPAGSKVVV